MGYSTSTEEATKALYAISALIRNNINGQEVFHSEKGVAMLQVAKSCFKNICTKVVQL
jgi:hsp70-interacting protein